MARWRRGVASVALAGALAAPAHAEERRGGFEHRARQVEDLLVLRPLSLVQTVVSVGVFVVAYPIARVFGDGEAVRENLLGDPVNRTFRRPLSEL